MDVYSFQFNCRDGRSFISAQVIVIVNFLVFLVQFIVIVDCLVVLIQFIAIVDYLSVQFIVIVGCLVVQFIAIVDYLHSSFHFRFYSVYSLSRLSSFFISFPFLYSLQSWRTVFILHFVFVFIQFIVLADCLHSSFRFRFYSSCQFTYQFGPSVHSLCTSSKDLSCLLVSPADGS